MQRLLAMVQPTRQDLQLLMLAYPTTAAVAQKPAVTTDASTPPKEEHTTKPTEPIHSRKHKDNHPAGSCSAKTPTTTTTATTRSFAAAPSSSSSSSSFPKPWWQSSLGWLLFHQDNHHNHEHPQQQQQQEHSSKQQQQQQQPPLVETATAQDANKNHQNKVGTTTRDGVWNALASLWGGGATSRPKHEATHHHHAKNGSKDKEAHATTPNPNRSKNTTTTTTKKEPDMVVSSTTKEQQPSTTTESLSAGSWYTHWSSALSTLVWLPIVDPVLFSSSSHEEKEDWWNHLATKILTSTPRLLAIANFLLALTYMLHTAVADWFLGGGGGHRASTTTTPPRQGPQSPPVGGDGMDAADPMGPTTTNMNQNNGAHHHMALLETGREKMGGFLVFKLLLVSAVITPDTLDLLILLSWYTLLAFLRSLAHLCANAVQHASAAGQEPAAGVWQLLVLIWMSNWVAAATCVTLLFTETGLGMVLLLTCDCALTAVHVLAYLLQHVQATWEIQHAATLQQLEEESQDPQFFVLGRRHDQGQTAQHQQQQEEEERRQDVTRQIQSLEERHNHCVSLLEGTVFCLQLLGNLITVCHFLHIWSWHGVQFTLIDGVLALHLHSAISSASQKIAQRRNLNRIARDLDHVFSNATPEELHKAAMAGDVCCVCLCSMTCSNKVKKVACGHLYHTSCLREVVERARSLEAARCPLCRASLLDGQYHTHNHHNNNNNNNTPTMTNTNNNENNDEPMNTNNTRNTTNNNNNNNTMGNRGVLDGAILASGLDTNTTVHNPPPAPTDALPQAQDQALFRISTEGIVPSWIPIHIPSFSFEVVRRAPSPPLVAEPPPAPATTTAAAAPPLSSSRPHSHTPHATIHATETDNDNTNHQNVDATEPQSTTTTTASSLFRQWLVVAGALSMSPEEESVALEQLVDMFPQYDRAELQRALREPGASAERVAERILSSAPPPPPATPS